MLLSQVIKNKYFKTAGIIFLVLLVLFITASIFLTSPKTFYRGIKIENIDISGLDRKNAEAVVRNRFVGVIKSKRVVLKYEGTAWSYKPMDISLEYPVEETLDYAYNLGRNGNIFNRVADILKLRLYNENISMEPSFDRFMLKKLLAGVKSQVDQEGENAYVKYINREIIVSKEKTGVHLDIDNNLKLIENHIVNGNFEAKNLIVEEKKPSILFENIKDINSVLSSFSTVFNPSDTNRTQNLKISCSKIDGLIIMPGEIFSMDKALGPRTIENGYKESKVIYKSEYVNGIGGGVCQITTTLYDAVLYSRLKVIERSHHTLPSIYVGPGQDATIAENYLDFKFKNDRDYPIAISAEVTRNKVYIRILGKPGAENYKVKLVPEILEEYPPEQEEIIIDDTIPDNQEIIVQHPKSGYRVVLFRELYDNNGELVEREKISDDVYKPVKAQIKVNSNNQKAKLVMADETNFMVLNH